MPRDLDAPAFLDVSTSLTGRRWIGPSAEAERLADTIVQRAELPLAVARVLAKAGVDPAGAETYLAPTLRDLMPDPRSLRDMDTAAGRFLAAVRTQQRIAVFGDYDVDGACSSALLIVWLRAMGLDATLYIPDRIDEGYGPNDRGDGGACTGSRPDRLR